MKTQRSGRLTTQGMRLARPELGLASMSRGQSPGPPAPGGAEWHPGPRPSARETAHRTEQYRDTENSKQSFKPKATEQATNWTPSWQDACLEQTLSRFLCNEGMTS